MRNISIFNIFGLLASLAVIFSVPQLVDWAFHHHFEKNILPYSPHASFELLFDEARISADRNLMYGIWLLISGLFLYLIYLNCRLNAINETTVPERKLQLSIFMQRIVAYIVIFTALPLNLLVLWKGSSGEILSVSNKLILASFIWVMLNSMALFPYLAQRHIAPFLKLKDVLTYNLGMAVMMSILLYFGVSQYIAPLISGMLSGFAFSKKIAHAWHRIENYFDIKGKRFHEMM